MSLVITVSASTVISDLCLLSSLTLLHSLMHVPLLSFVITATIPTAICLSHVHMPIIPDHNPLCHLSKTD